MRAIWFAAVAVGVWSSTSEASVIRFVPPNDMSGMVFSTNSNDAYGTRRGIVFSVTSDTTITSVGFYQNLTDQNVSFSIDKVSSLIGQVDAGATVLASGSKIVNTNGLLEFVDFGVSNTKLLAGNDYLIDFGFNGLSNQNFFYNNQNIPFAQGSFAAIDGTQGGNASNFVLPAIRLSTLDTVNGVPEPSTWAMMLLGFGGLGFLGYRKSQKGGRAPMLTA